MSTDKESKGRMDPEIKNLILWRIEASVPKHFRLVMGDKGAFDKEELKRHVEEEDDVGMKFVEIELNFIKALSTGEFTRTLVE